MLKKYEWKSSYMIHILAVIIILFACCVNIRKLDYINVINDEFGYWSFAISAAGYDWKDLIAETPYYAWGYSIWLIPIAAILPTPELWYKAAIFLNVFFLCCSYFLCYNCGKRLFPNESKILIGLAGIVVTIYPGNVLYAQITWTENIQYLLMWIATYLIIHLNERFRIREYLLLIGVFIYSYMVHARNIGFILAGIICIGLILIKHKKNIGYFALCILLMVLGYKLNGVIKDYQLAMLYDNSAASNLNNVSVNLKTTAYYFHKMTDQIKLFISSLGGKYMYLLLGSGLTLPIVIIKIMKNTVEDLKKKNLLRGYNISYWWCILSQAAMWGICAVQMNRWTARKDLIVYGRYMEAVIGPILFLGIMYVLILVKESRVGLSIAIVSCMVGLYPLYYCVSTAKGLFAVMCSPVVGAFYQWAQGDTRKAFLCLAVFVTVIAVVLLTATLVNDQKRKAAIVLSLFGIVFGIIGYQASLYMVETRQRADNETVPLRTKIIREYNDYELFFIKNSELDQYSDRPKYFQFLIPEKPIHVIAMEDLENLTDQEVLIMTHYKDEEAIDVLENELGAKEIDSSWVASVYAMR